MSKIIFPIGYYPDPAKFGTVALGSLYIGDVDTDPTVVGNQKTVTAIQESGTTVGIAQPISLNAGGVPTYAGSVALLTVDGDYSMTVEREDSTVAYTIPNAAAYTAESILPTATEDQIIQKGASVWEAVDTDVVFPTATELQTLQKGSAAWLAVDKEVETVADLVAITDTPSEGQQISVAGYYVTGDGGGQELVWDADSVLTHNGYTIFKLDAIATGRYLSISDGLSVRHAGAKGDGSNIDTTFIQAAADYEQANGGTTYFSDGTYIIDAPITFSGRYSIKGESVAKTNIQTTADIKMISIALDVDNYYSEISDLTFIGSGGLISTGNAAIYLHGTDASYHNFGQFHHLRFLGTYYGIRVDKSYNPGSHEMNFDWNQFSNIQSTNAGSNECEYPIFSNHGSGTGNVYTDMNLVFSSRGITWAAETVDDSNVGDIIISSIQFGSNTSTGDCLFFGSQANYKSNIAIQNCQFDGGVAVAWQFLGTAWGRLNLQGLIWGGGVTNTFTNPPTSSLIELVTGFYGYDTATGASTAIYEYV